MRTLLTFKKPISGCKTLADEHNNQGHANQASRRPKLLQTCPHAGAWDKCKRCDAETGDQKHTTDFLGRHQYRNPGSGARRSNLHDGHLATQAVPHCKRIDANIGRERQDQILRT